MHNAKQLLGIVEYLNELQAGVFQTISLLPIDTFWIGFEQIGQAKYLVDQIAMVHAVVVAQDLAEVTATAPDHTSTGLSKKAEG